MTGYTVHTGTSKKFASGWDDIFGDKPKKNGKKASKKKLAKKKAGVSAKSGAKKKNAGRKQAARKPKK